MGGVVWGVSLIIPGMLWSIPVVVLCLFLLGIVHRMLFFRFCRSIRLVVHRMLLHCFLLMFFLFVLFFVYLFVLLFDCGLRRLCCLL